MAHVKDRSRFVKKSMNVNSGRINRVGGGMVIPFPEKSDWRVSNSNQGNGFMMNGIEDNNPDLFVALTVANLKKTHPAMADAVAREWLSQKSQGMGDLGFDFGALFSTAAQSLVSTATSYAGAKAQQNLALDAAKKSAQIASDQLKTQQATATLEQQKQLKLDAANKMYAPQGFTLSGTSPILWVSLAGLSGLLIYRLFFMDRPKKRK